MFKWELCDLCATITTLVNMNLTTYLPLSFTHSYMYVGRAVLCNCSWSSGVSDLCSLTRWCHWLDSVQVGLQVVPWHWARSHARLWNYIGCWLCFAVGQGHWPGSLVSGSFQLYPADGWLWRLFSMVVLGCYPGSLVRWDCRLRAPIGWGQLLGSLPGPGDRLYSAIR